MPLLLSVKDSRPLSSSASGLIRAATLIFVVLLGGVSPLPGGRALASPAQRRAGKTYTPAAGTPERRALLDAVRKKLGIDSQFKVYHLSVNGDWAYFNGGEVVELEGEELQETDLGVSALLRRGKGAAGRSSWTVVEMWTLPTEEQLSHEEFVKRVFRRQKAENIPLSIFPHVM
jgi:hypothetical protein